MARAIVEEAIQPRLGAMRVVEAGNRDEDGVRFAGEDVGTPSSAAPGDMCCSALEVGTRGRRAVIEGAGFGGAAGANVFDVGAVVEETELVVGRGGCVEEVDVAIEPAALELGEHLSKALARKEPGLLVPAVFADAAAVDDYVSLHLARKTSAGSRNNNIACLSCAVPRLAHR